MGDNRITGLELMIYLTCDSLSDNELYKLLYRNTDRFNQGYIDLLSDELLPNSNIPFTEWITISNRIEAVLSRGDDGTYQPTHTILTDDILNEIRIAMEYAKEVKGDMKTRIEQQYQRLGGVYATYKDYYLEYKILNCSISLVNNPFCNRFDLLGEMVKLYVHDLQPFMKLFVQPQQEPQQDKQPYSGILQEKLIEDMITQGLIKRTENGLRWIKTAALYGFFIEQASDKLGLRYSNNKVPWRKFSFFENHNKLLATARQAVNKYKINKLPPPEGDYIVNDILKEIE